MDSLLVIAGATAELWRRVICPTIGSLIDSLPFP